MPIEEKATRRKKMMEMVFAEFRLKHQAADEAANVLLRKMDNGNAPMEHKLRSMKSTLQLYQSDAQSKPVADIREHYQNLEEYADFLKHANAQPGKPVLYYSKAKEQYCFQIKVGDEYVVYYGKNREEVERALNEMHALASVFNIQTSYETYVTKRISQKTAQPKKLMGIVDPVMIQQATGMATRFVQLFLGSVNNANNAVNGINSAIGYAGVQGINTNELQVIEQQGAALTGLMGQISLIASTLPAQMSEVNTGYALLTESDDLYRKAQEYAEDSEVRKDMIKRSCEKAKTGIGHIVCGGTGVASTLSTMTASGIQIATILDKIPMSNVALSYLTAMAPGMLGLLHVGLLTKQYMDADDLKKQLKNLSAWFKFFAVQYPSEHMPEIPAGVLEEVPEFRTILEQKMLGMQLCTYLGKQLKEQYDQTWKGAISNSLQFGVSVGTLLQSGLVKGALLAAGVSAASMSTMGIALGAIALAGCAAAYVNYRRQQDAQKKSDAEKQLLQEYGGIASTEDGFLLRLYFAVSAEQMQQAQMELHKSQQADPNARPRALTQQFDIQKSHEPVIGLPENVMIGTKESFGPLVKQMTGLSPKEFIASMNILLEKLGVNPAEDQIFNQVDVTGLQYGISQTMKSNADRAQGGTGAQFTVAGTHVGGKENQTQIAIRTSNPILAEKAVLEAIRKAEQEQKVLQTNMPKLLLDYWQLGVNHQVEVNNARLKQISDSIDITIILDDSFRETMEKKYTDLLSQKLALTNRFNDILKGYRNGTITDKNSTLKDAIDGHKKLQLEFQNKCEAVVNEIDKHRVKMKNDSSLFKNKL